MVFLIMLAVIFLANFYVVLRLWQMMPPTVLGRTLLVVMAVFVVSSFFLTFFIGGKLPLAVTTFMYKVGTAWFFIMLYLVLIFLVLDIVRLTRLVPMGFMHGNWLSMGIIAGIVTVILTAGYFRYLDKKRTELNIAVTKDIPEGRSIKIVAVSDLHLGYGIGMKELRRWISIINSENPDIVLIAGDMIDSNLRPLHENGIAGIFKEIKAKHGIYVSPGNHEYIAGIAPSLAFLNDAGLTVLRDSTALVDNMVYIVGRDDLSNRSRKSIGELTAPLDTSKPVIMLDHQPYNLERAAAAGIDLQLSGHTHRGQVWPLSLLTDYLYEVSYGYLKKNNTNFYISSGLGIWGGKFRIGTRSEYVVINLKGQQ